MRVQVRLHDQVRRLAVRQPDAADRGHRRADHHRVANRRRGRRREHQDDHQRADRQSDHRDAVENARGEGDDRGHRDDRRQDRAAVAAQQEERDPFEHPRLRDDRDEERQAEDEQHRVGVDQVVEAVEREQVLRAPRPPALLGDLAVPLRVSMPQNVATMTSAMP